MVSIRPREPQPKPARTGSLRLSLVVGGLLVLAAALLLAIL
jgi:hypothetical protein